MDYVKKVVNAEAIGLIDEFHIGVPARHGTRQYDDLHRPLTSTDAAGREFMEIMRYIFNLREQHGVTHPVIVNFETGIANAEKEIKALAAVLAQTPVGIGL
jgi:pyruvate-formate lyase-activating enzyme